LKLLAYEGTALNFPKTYPTLSRRQVLRGVTALAATSVLSGCGASVFSSAAPTASRPVGNPQPLPTGAITAGSMTIAATTAGSFTKEFVGLAYEKQTLHLPLFTGANSELIGLFGLLGQSLLRIGGDSVDENVWTPNGKGQIPGEIAPSDVDALAAFLSATGWTCIYGINLGGSATGATTPVLAAAEIAYVTQALGPSLVGIEIGNECENYRDAGSFYQFNWTVEMFETLWIQYRDAIVAQTPNAPIAGPAAGSNVAGWTIPWGESVTKSQFSLLTQHYYRGPGDAATATVENLLSADTALTAELALLKDGAESIGVPFRIAECNSYWDGGAANVSNTYASSLWAIDMVFQCALGGATGVNFQGGDHSNYTPIEDNFGPIVGPRPILYGLVMAAMAGEGTLLSSELNASSLNVTGYAVQNTAGDMSLLLVNKDATQTLDLSIVLPVSHKAMTSATLQLMTQLSTDVSSPSLNATSGVTIQGGSIATDGAFAPSAAYSLDVTGEQISCYVPALSAVLIQLK
jgi:hypothetical protein